MTKKICLSSRVAIGTYTIGTEGNPMAYCFYFESSLFETQIVFGELRKKSLLLCDLWTNFFQYVLSVVMCVLHFAVCDLRFVKNMTWILLTVPFIS